MIDVTMKIAVVGLGVLGGSYAKGLHDAGYSITGIDIDAGAIQYALDNQWIEKGGSDPLLIADCDIVISCLYPHTFVKWVRENQKYMKPGAYLTDVTGIKGAVIDQINSFLREDVEYIACHPMAGREYKGILYADSNLFLSANFIIVPTADNTPEAVKLAEDIAHALKFRKISVLSPEEHDRMIGFLSQLTHVIAVSLMNANDNPELVNYTGDSFRDLTRIANINEDLWPELFVLNKQNLINEIDEFVKEMNTFKNLLETEDIPAMKQKLIQSTERRKRFNKKKES